MISSDERQILSILLKWEEEQSPICVIGVFAAGGYVSFPGRVRLVTEDCTAIVTGAQELELHFAGATAMYGEVKEAPAGIAAKHGLAPDGMLLDITFPNGDRCALYELARK
jgi:hypothetical protein